MLRKKIITKIFLVTLIIFLLIVITSFNNPKFIPNNKAEDKKDLVSIYLLNKNNYLTEVMVLVNNKDNFKVINEIVDNLKNKNILFNNLHGLIPNNTKINSIKLDNNILYIDFNNELFNVNSNIEEKIVESLIFSITSLPNIDGLNITINGKKISELPQSKIKLNNILTKDFGINKEYAINSTNNIQKLVLYYYSEINNKNYYVPVTKYINNKDSSDNKVKIIIDNLRNSYLARTNLMSYLNNRLSLIEYQEYDEMVTLSFNNLITLDANNANEEVIYTISNSIFDSMNIKKIIFMEKDKIISIKERS